MDKHELYDLLQGAQDKLFEAIEDLRYYVRETGDTNAKAYLVDHLEIMASREHSFLSRDLNIDDLKDRVMGDEDDW